MAKHTRSELRLVQPSFKQYQRKGQLAVNFLLRKKIGEVPKAIYNKNVGWIDLVWGYEGTENSDGFGLSKIYKYHKEVVSKLSNIIKSLPVKRRSKNRIILENNQYRVVIAMATFEGENMWLLSAFYLTQKKKS